MLESVFNMFERIEGTPKHVPITTAHPTTPLKKGNNTLFPKPTFAFSFLSVLYTVLYVFGSCTVLNVFGVS